MHVQWVFVAAPAGPLAVAAWLYPTAVSVLAQRRREVPASEGEPSEWPTVSIVLSGCSRMVMRGREMNGWLRVEPDAVRAKRSLERLAASDSVRLLAVVRIVRQSRQRSSKGQRCHHQF